MSFRLSALIGALLLAASVAGHAQNLAIQVEFQDAVVDPIGHE